jgi:hypothetical protein
MNETHGVATVFVTHDLSQAKCAKRIIELRDGKIIGDQKEEQEMSKASRIYAWGEIKDHRRIYAIIIIVIALTMSSFMLTHAAILYTSQVISSTTKMALSSDVCILAPGSDERDLYGGAVEIPDAGEIEKTINELPGYRASVRCVLQGSYNVGDGFDGCVIQGIDLKGMWNWRR